MSMDIFRHCSLLSVLHGVTLPILSPLSGPTCIVYGRFPALFGRPSCIALSTNQILSAGLCIVYGRFPAVFVTVRSCILHSVTSQVRPPVVGTYVYYLWAFSALFGCPFCIALSTNQILSAPTCISYGRFPALFSRFFCFIEMSREARRSTIAPSFEIVLRSQTIINKRANESDFFFFFNSTPEMARPNTIFTINIRTLETIITKHTRRNQYFEHTTKTNTNGNQLPANKSQNKQNDHR